MAIPSKWRDFFTTFRLPLTKFRRTVIQWCHNEEITTGDQMFLREGTQRPICEMALAIARRAASSTPSLSAMPWCSERSRQAALLQPDRSHLKYAAFMAAVIVICGGQAVAEDRRTGVSPPPAKPAEVEMPREILPWRSSVEQAASNLLASARLALSLGNQPEAQRQLEVLAANYPGTHAAALGRKELSDLQSRMIADRVGRHGLGSPVAGEASTQDTKVFDPVGGWQVSVKRKPFDLGEALLEDVGDRVFFSDGSAQLIDRTRAILKKQAHWLQARPDVVVRIVGHADDKGSDVKNLTLSHDRAVVVRNHLMLYGVAPRRLHVLSHGKAQPIAICSADTCAAQNRRVVIEIRPVRRADASSD